MKIIKTDNYARETIADFLIADNITNKEYAEMMCNALCEHPKKRDDDWFKVVQDDYNLSRGMEDLV